jgi:hypothetical protein
MGIAVKLMMYMYKFQVNTNLTVFLRLSGAIARRAMTAIATGFNPWKNAVLHCHTNPGGV